MYENTDMKTCMNIFMDMCACSVINDLEEANRRTWSQSVQRDLPRPSDINTTILKGAPHRDQKYRDLYEVSVQFTKLVWVSEATKNNV